MSHDRKHFDEEGDGEEDAEINRLIHNGFERAKFVDWFNALKTKKEKSALVSRIYEFCIQAGMERRHIIQAYEMAHVEPDEQIDYALEFRGNLPGLENWIVEVNDEIAEKFYFVLIHVFWFVEYPIYLECKEYGSCNHWWHRDLG